MTPMATRGFVRWSSRGAMRHRFWCALARREVEVKFDVHRVAGLRWTTAVRACSAFDPPTAVACARRCRDATFRRQWAPALPVFTRRQG